MPLQALQNRIESFWSSREDTFRAEQDAYFAANGKYWQGLFSHAAPLDNSSNRPGDPPDNLTSSPTDQSETWVDVFGTQFNATSFPARLRLDVYDSPVGKGWVAIFEVIHDAETWTRAHGHGPLAAQFEQGWTQVVGP